MLVPLMAWGVWNALEGECGRVLQAVAMVGLLVLLGRGTAFNFALATPDPRQEIMTTFQAMQYPKDETLWLVGHYQPNWRSVHPTLERWKDHLHHGIYCISWGRYYRYRAEWWPLKQAKKHRDSVLRDEVEWRERVGWMDTLAYVSTPKSHWAFGGFLRGSTLPLYEGYWVSLHRYPQKGNTPIVGRTR